MVSYFTVLIRYRLRVCVVCGKTAASRQDQHKTCTLFSHSVLSTLSDLQRPSPELCQPHRPSFPMTLCGSKPRWFQTSASQIKPINMWSSSDWRTANSQSVRADETHYSFDCHFYLTAQNHFCSVNSRSPKGPDWFYTSKREKRSKHVGTPKPLSALASEGGAFSLLARR